MKGVKMLSLMKLSNIKENANGDMKKNPENECKDMAQNKGDECDLRAI